jgi:septal ring-binding cell division protein DamX
MTMNAKNVLYAAVGAPVVAARRVGERAGEMSTKLSEQATGYTKTLEKKVDVWAAEGQKVIGKIGDQKVVEDITSRVDLDQAKDQVSKLRDQLEDMLATWRTSFRPEETGTKAPVGDTTPKSTVAKKPAAKKPTAKKPAAKTTTAKSTKTSAAKTTKSPAAKTSSAKTSAADKATKAS